MKVATIIRSLIVVSLFLVLTLGFYEVNLEYANHYTYILTTIFFLLLLLSTFVKQKSPLNTLMLLISSANFGYIGLGIIRLLLFKNSFSQSQFLNFNPTIFNNTLIFIIVSYILLWVGTEYGFRWKLRKHKNKNNYKLFVYNIKYPYLIGLIIIFNIIFATLVQWKIININYILTFLINSFTNGEFYLLLFIVFLTAIPSSFYTRKMKIWAFIIILFFILSITIRGSKSGLFFLMIYYYTIVLASYKVPKISKRIIVGWT